MKDKLPPLGNTMLYEMRCVKRLDYHICVQQPTRAGQRSGIEQGSTSKALGATQRGTTTYISTSRAASTSIQSN